MIWFRGPRNSYNITSGQRYFSNTWYIYRERERDFLLAFRTSQWFPPSKMTTRKLLGVIHFDMHQKSWGQNGIFSHPFFRPGACRRSTTEGTVISFRTSRPPAWVPIKGETRARHQWSPRPVSRSGGSWHWHNLTRKADQTRAQQKCYVAVLCVFLGKEWKETGRKGICHKDLSIEN